MRFLEDRSGPLPHLPRGASASGRESVTDQPLPQPTPQPKETPQGSSAIPKTANLKHRIMATLAYVVLRLIAATIRFRLEDRSGLFSKASPPERLLFAVWHNRLALILTAYRRHVLRYAPERRLAAMVSASRDGAMLARVLELFKVQPVRGSSSRRGPPALREMVSWAERGYDLALTPDGPRGPC